MSNSAIYELIAAISGGLIAAVFIAAYSGMRMGLAPPRNEKPISEDQGHYLAWVASSSLALLFLLFCSLVLSLLLSRDSWNNAQNAFFACVPFVIAIVVFVIAFVASHPIFFPDTNEDEDKKKDEEKKGEEKTQYALWIGFSGLWMFFSLIVVAASYWIVFITFAGKSLFYRQSQSQAFAILVLLAFGFAALLLILEFFLMWLFINRKSADLAATKEEAPTQSPAPGAPKTDLSKGILYRTRLVVFPFLLALVGAAGLFIGASKNNNSLIVGGSIMVIAGLLAPSAKKLSIELLASKLDYESGVAIDRVASDGVIRGPKLEYDILPLAEETRREMFTMEAENNLKVPDGVDKVVAEIRRKNPNVIFNDLRKNPPPPGGEAAP